MDKIYITKIDEVVEDADTFFPNISEDDYDIVNFKILSKKATVYIYKKIDI